MSDLSTSTPPSPIAVERSFVVAVAIVSIVLGIIALVWPNATLVTVALLFGAHLIAAGVFRLVVAIAAGTLSSRFRWLLGLLGALILVAGVIALANPTQTVIVLAVIVGAGWLIDGIAAITGALGGRSALPRWLTVIGGVVSIIGGIVLLAVPGWAVGSLVLAGGWILIAIGVTTLFSLPAKTVR